MAITEKHDMLLFSVQVCYRPYKYRAYFAELIPGAQPIIHRLVCPSKGEFSSLQPGNTYSIKYSGMNIKDAYDPKPHEMFDDEYFDLLDRRDNEFMDKRTSKSIGRGSAKYSPADCYYDYATFTALLDYNPTFAHKAGVTSLRILAGFISIVLPLFIYLYMLYLRSTGTATSIGFMTIPLLGIFAFPFLLFLMYTFTQLSELSLLNLEFSRPDMLRYYCLSWGGLRKNCYTDKSMKKYMLIFGFSSLIVFLLVYLLTL